MQRFIALLFFLFTFGTLVSAQQLSDDQVIQYVKEAQKQGKTQKQMTAELAAKGVTTEQVERIKSKYQNQQQQEDKQNKFSSSSRQRKQGMETPLITKDKRKATAETDAEEGEELLTEQNKDTELPENQIFGHNIFTNSNLTFEPNVNMATPTNYKLGPGDEVIIDVWGVSENSIRQTISPEGSILVSNIGPVYLSGMTVKEANSYLQREFTKIYSGIAGARPSSQVKLTLGQIRTIQISIMGEVTVPGTYTLSSFSSVFHALYRAGGVNRIGSLRSIKVVRAGRTVADLDVYDFILKGKMKDDVRLQEGDVIIVNPYDCLVKITGKAKRPMFYEMKNTESISTLLKYAGGFTGDAYKKAVRLIRKSGQEHQVFNIDEMDYSVFKLADGDQVMVDSVLERFENRVEIKGAVFRPGLYQVDGDVNTVKRLIQKAEGLRGDAFMNRAVIYRENEDLSREVLQVNLRALMQGTLPDIPLQRNDVLYIAGLTDLKEEGTLTIHGEVGAPGTYLYADNMSVEDLILQAGGLLEAASTARIDVTRRIKDPKNAEYNKTVGKTFSFEFKDGYLVGDSAFFQLKPFDEVYVRRSPAYRTQQNVSVNGEVLFAGTYALSKKNERLSDLIGKAGGVTPDAYVKGARLVRRMTEEERRRQEDLMRLAQKGGKDSISADVLEVPDTYVVGIDLQKALAKPNSSDDLVLREGDALFVPEYINTVKISGEVMYPNTVLYQKDKGLKYYLEQAGGYSEKAKKRRAYVVHLNGTVAQLKGNSANDIEPGSEIVIPTKEEGKKMTLAQTISIGTSLASLASVITSLIYLIK